MFTGITRNEANISIEPHINKFLHINNFDKNIYKNNRIELWKYWHMHDLKDAKTGATCLECLFKIYQKDTST